MLLDLSDPSRSKRLKHIRVNSGVERTTISFRLNGRVAYVDSINERNDA